MRIKTGLTIILLATFFTVAGCAAIGENVSGVDQQVVSDLVAERTITRAIYANPQLSGSNILVGCVDGVVTLSGDVETGSQSALAESIAQDVVGVNEVRNNLTSG